jgi:hypothetical protein
MRILTIEKNELFEIAFEYIARVVAVTHTTDKIYEIKVQNRNDKSLEQIPKAIRDMFIKAGIPKMQNLFMPIKKEETVEMLIKKFIDDAIQPREYIFDGLLVISPTKVIGNTYTAYASENVA